MSEITGLEIHELLAARHQIALIWSVEDVQAVRPDLGEQQSWEVLQQAEHSHDCNYGITWDSLAADADWLFKKCDVTDERHNDQQSDSESAADRQESRPVSAS